MVSFRSTHPFPLINHVAMTSAIKSTTQGDDGCFTRLRGLFASLATRLSRPLRERMREDFRLGVILLCGLVSVLALGAFAVFRFMRGDLLIVLVDLGLVITIILATVHAWRSGDTQMAGLVMVGVNTVGCLVVAAMAGISGLFWAFNAVVMNFFMAERRPAVIASGLLVLSIMLMPVPGLELPQRISFCATCALVSVYAFIFASRANLHAFRLQQLAALDPLTGLGNRRLFDADLRQLVQQARNWGFRPALAVLDLDHFKRINDQFGHEAGDRALVDFAAILRSGLRQSDRLYRIGGEEFVLLVPDSDEQGLSILLAQVQALLRAQLRGPGGPVTVSIGAALLAADEDGRHWLARADQALYAAKRGGRDRTVLA